MKLSRLVWIWIVALIFSSCQKELSCETCNSVESSGSLQSGATGDCLPKNVAGNYTSNKALVKDSNFIEVTVEVLTKGSYYISSDTINGYSFRGFGTFDATGLQTVRLQGYGKPVTAGVNTFSIHYDHSVCALGITVTAPATGGGGGPGPNPGPTNAVYTLSGAPGNCTTPVLMGSYSKRVQLGIGNTVTLKVDISTAGAYLLTTDTINGIYFSGSGVFTSTGTGIPVTLTGKGIPLNEGSTTLRPKHLGSACSFNVTIGAEPPAVYTCSIDGISYTFTDRVSASILNSAPSTPVPWIWMNGYTAPGNPMPSFTISIINNSHTPVTQGTYFTRDGVLLPSGYDMQVDYRFVNPDQSITTWHTNSGVDTPPFTIVITTITPYRVTGIFNGKLGNPPGSILKTITEGEFDIPIP